MTLALVAATLLAFAVVVAAARQRAGAASRQRPLALGLRPGPGGNPER